MVFIAQQISLAEVGKEQVMVVRPIFASFASIAFMGTALAADLPTRKTAPEFTPPPPPFTWTGFYVGGYAGGGFGSAHWNDLPFPNFTNGSNLDPSGFVGGGLAGFNYQTGPAVFGIEGEVGYNGVSSSQDYIYRDGTLRHEKFDSSDVERIRGRLGYAFNNALLYFAGGGSFTDGRLSIFNPAFGTGAAVSKSYTGFNVGGGVEYAFTSNWIGRVEYIYDDFGNETYAPGAFDARRVSFTENTVRAAIEYKF
jgi:outer membrane immunogenic protein